MTTLMKWNPTIELAAKCRLDRQILRRRVSLFQFTDVLVHELKCSICSYLTSPRSVWVQNKGAA